MTTTEAPSRAGHGSTSFWSARRGSRDERRKRREDTTYQKTYSSKVVTLVMRSYGFAEGLRVGCRLPSRESYNG